MTRTDTLRSMERIVDENGCADIQRLIEEIQEAFGQRLLDIDEMPHFIDVVVVSDDGFNDRFRIHLNGEVE